MKNEKVTKIKTNNKTEDKIEIALQRLPKSLYRPFVDISKQTIKSEIKSVN